MLKRNFNYWIVLSLLGLSIFFVFLHANSFNAPLSRDEGHYAYGAWLMTKGMTPYVDTFEQKPPMIFYPYLLSIMISPDEFWPPRLVAAISLILTLILLGLTIGREYGGRAGWITVWLALPMIMFPYLYPFAANTEKFLLLPLIGTLAVYVFYRNENSGWPWFWAGVCGAIAILYKPTAILPVFYIFGVWLIEDKKRSLLKFFSAVCGGLAAFFVFSGYFLLRGALPVFWEQLVIYNIYYISYFRGYYWLGDNFRFFFPSWTIISLLLIWFLVKFPSRGWFYLGLMLVAWAAIFKAPYSHYYIMLMPFMAIVAAVALNSLAVKITEIIKRPKWCGAVALTLGLLTILLVIWPVRNYYLMPPADLLVRFASPLNPFVEAPIVARRVALLSQPEDRVFIAGSEPEILYYAKRLSPTRFSGGMYGLMMEHPKALEYQREVVDTLEKHPPKLIVFVRSNFSWLRQEKSPTLILDYTIKLLREHYEVIGGYVQRDEAAYWEEPLKIENETSCSLLLFRRKDK